MRSPWMMVCAGVLLVSVSCAPVPHSPHVRIHANQTRGIDQYWRDRAYCEGKAQELVGASPGSKTAESTATTAVTAGAIGAAVGAIFGAVLGDPATGAALGGGSGLALGAAGGAGAGVQGQEILQARLNTEFANCMENYGHIVKDQPPAYVAPYPPVPPGYRR